MDNFEKKLNKLPQQQLSKRADLKIRTKLYFILWQKRLIDFPVAFEFPQLRLAPVVATVLLILIVIVPGYAYASDKVTLGHVLYPVKTALEQAELKLSQSPEAQVKTYEKFAERRLAEANVLSQQGEQEEENLVKTVTAAVSLTETAAVVAETAPSKEVEELVNKAQVEQVSALTEVAQNVGINARETTVDKIALALEKIKERKPKNEETSPLVKPDNSFEAETETEIATSAPKLREPAVAESEEATSSSRRFDLPDRNFPNRFRRPESEPEANKEVIVPPEMNDNEAVEVAEPENEEAAAEEEADTGAASEEFLKRTRTNIEKLKNDLPRERYRSEDVDSLFKRLDEKLQKAEEAIRNNDEKSLKETLDAAGAITNNATSFIKPKQENKNSKDKGNNLLDRFRPNSKSDSETDNEDSGEQVDNQDKNKDNEDDKDNSDESNRRFNLRDNSRRSNN